MSDLDERIYDALVELARSVDQQNELLQQQIALTKSLIGSLAENAQQVSENTQEIQRRER